MTRKVYKWFVISVNLVLVFWFAIQLITIQGSGSSSDTPFTMFLTTISIDSVYNSFLALPLFPTTQLCNLFFSDIDVLVLKFVSIVLDLNIYICLFNIVVKIFLYLPLLFNKLISKGGNNDE